MKILQPKKETFQIKKKSYIFHISDQNIDCEYSLEPHRRGGLTSTTIYVFEQNKKNNVYPCKPQFYYIKVGFKEVKIIQACFRDLVLAGYVMTSGKHAYIVFNPLNPTFI